jgi:GxxExxY protein
LRTYSKNHSPQREQRYTEENAMTIAVAPARTSVNQLTHAIIAAAMKVHSNLGPGLLESAYEACLAFELRKSGHHVETQVGLPVIYEGVRLEVGYRIDIVVDDLVILEIKSVEAFAPIHEAQLMSYMKLSGKCVGLLINFNVVHLRDGIKRRVIGTSWRNN